MIDDVVRAFLIINAVSMSSIATLIVARLPANDTNAAIVAAVALSAIFSGVIVIAERAA